MGLFVDVLWNGLSTVMVPVLRAGTQEVYGFPGKTFLMVIKHSSWRSAQKAPPSLQRRLHVQRGLLYLKEKN